MSRKLMLVGGFLAVLILAAWYMLLWKPVGDDLAAADARRDAAEAEVNQLTSEKASLQSLELERPAMQSELEVLRAAVPDTADEDELILSVNGAADAAGVEFVTLQASEPTPGTDGLDLVTAQITGTGGYFQVLDFLNRIAAIQRIVLVDTLSLTALTAEDGIGPPDINWTMQLRAYVTSAAPAPDETAAGTEPAATDAGATGSETGGSE